MKKKEKLIVLAAFDWIGKELIPAFEPREMPTEDRAIYEAKLIAAKHSGVIAWKREANSYLSEYGPPTVLFQEGDIPDLD